MNRRAQLARLTEMAALDGASLASEGKLVAELAREGDGGAPIDPELVAKARERLERFTGLTLEELARDDGAASPSVSGTLEYASPEGDADAGVARNAYREFLASVDSTSRGSK